MHPSHDELKSYLVGTLTYEKADSIADHVHQCPECEATVVRLESSDDTVIGGLRNPAPPDSFEQELSCQRMLAAVEAIGCDDVLPSFVGKYEILSKLAEGGMGTVYKARHPKLKRAVALKVLHAKRPKDHEMSARFEREMEAVGNLNHPNIVVAHDAGVVAGMHFLAMELVDGIDLAKLVHSVGPFNVSDACELIRQAAAGLHHAHRKGIIHRDVKPSNLMLAQTDDAAPIVKILDLGIARFKDADAAGRRDLTNVGQPMGTPEYMAPEQGTDSHNVDVRADIYSLGAALYTLLTGEPPFSIKSYGSPMKLMVARTNEDAPSVAQKRSDLPEDLVRIVDRMLARNPAERFSSADEVATVLVPFATSNDLHSLFAGAGVPVPSRSTEQVSREPNAAKQAKRPRSWRILGGVAVALILVIAATVLVIRGRDGKIKQQIELEPGDKVEFISDSPFAVSSSESLDRQIAKWAITFGGRVDIRGHGYISDVGKLPAGDIRIKTLDLDKIEDESKLSIALLNRLQDLPELEGVIASTPALDDDGLKAIVKAKRLKWLYLSGSKITYKGLRLVDSLDRLESLGLNETGISDQGICSLRHLPNLDKLELNVTNITDKSIVWIGRNKKLTTLSITRTKITDEGVKYLQSRLPNCQIIADELDGKDNN